MSLAKSKNKFKSHVHCAVFGELLSFSIFLIFRQNFDRCPFDELSYDVISMNGCVRSHDVFEGKPHSTKDERVFDKKSRKPFKYGPMIERQELIIV